VLRIPADIEKDMRLKGDEAITISKQGRNRIVIEVE
jgi:antitoxin component of MazEF toxin-antitoxin module